MNLEPDPAVVGPTFTPAAPDVYTFQLIVNDTHIDSPADTVVITVNTVPVADAGADQFIDEPLILITLDGSGSSDADGDPLNPDHEDGEIEGSDNQPFAGHEIMVDVRPASRRNKKTGEVKTFTNKTYKAAA